MNSVTVSDSDEKWYAFVDGNNEGPMNREALAQELQRGRYTAQTFLWKPGRENWMKAGEIPELESAFGKRASAGDEARAQTRYCPICGGEGFTAIKMKIEERTGDQWPGCRTTLGALAATVFSVACVGFGIWCVLDPPGAGEISSPGYFGLMLTGLVGGVFSLQWLLPSLRYILAKKIEGVKYRCRQCLLEIDEHGNAIGVDFSLDQHVKPISGTCWVCQKTIRGVRVARDFITEKNLVWVKELGNQCPSCGLMFCTYCPGVKPGSKKKLLCGNCKKPLPLDSQLVVMDVVGFRKKVVKSRDSWLGGVSKGR